MISHHLSMGLIDDEKLKPVIAVAHSRSFPD